MRLSLVNIMETRENISGSAINTRVVSFIFYFVFYFYDFLLDAWYFF